jgi:hypothetical protein
MLMGIYQLGTGITITETFTVLGVPTDPTTVVFTVQDPGGLDTGFTFGLDGNVSNPDVGVYVLDLSPPAYPGIYHYSVTGTGAVEATGGGDFTVLPSAVDSLDLPWAQDGPCTPWCDASDVSLNCGSPTVITGVGSGADEALIDMTPYAWMGSWLMWMLSGRRYSGSCERTVRPCGSRPCGFQTLPGGYTIWPTPDGLPGWWNGSAWNVPGFGGCGCEPLDRIKLAGYPIREIIEVKIDGIDVPEANNWRLDGWRFLTRMADANGDPQYWPACQRLDMDDTEVGTFAVTYAYGQDPPLFGQLAAAQVACEIFKGTTGGECALPSGTVRVSRQGITIDKLAALGWFRTSTNGWQTGLGVVDAFLNAANPQGNARRPMIMVPGQRSLRYAQSVGQ